DEATRPGSGEAGIVLPETPRRPASDLRSPLRPLRLVGELGRDHVRDELGIEYRITLLSAGVERSPLVVVDGLLVHGERYQFAVSKGGAEAVLRVVGHFDDIRCAIVLVLALPQHGGFFRDEAIGRSHLLPEQLGRLMLRARRPGEPGEGIVYPATGGP